MSRRHLTFVLVAVASLVVGACNTAAPTGPRPAAAAHDETDQPTDSTSRIGTIGSSG